MSASASPKIETIDPLAGCTFDLLLEGAVRLRSAAIALSGGIGTPSFSIGEVATRSKQLAQLMADIGLVGGETIAIYGVASPETICAIFAACRLGLHIALLPLQMPRSAVHDRLSQLGAVAVISVATHGEIDVGAHALDCALQTPSVRLVGMLEGPVPDGAVDLCHYVDPFFNAVPATPEITSLLITFEAQNEAAWQPVIQQQVKLVTAALALIETAHITQRTHLLSTLPPASQAGLVVGPLVMLLSGACLHYHSPFDAFELERHALSLQSLQLIAPLKLYKVLKQAAWFTTHRVTSYIGLSRWRADGLDFQLPTDHADDIKIVDLHAFGEHASLALGRERGLAQMVLDKPRHLIFGGTEILALEARRGAAGTIVFSGAAV